jgi:hypothetical protein
MKGKALTKIHNKSCLKFVSSFRIKEIVFKKDQIAAPKNKRIENKLPY